MNKDRLIKIVNILLQLILVSQASCQIQIITTEFPYSPIEVSDSRLTNENLLIFSYQETLIGCASQCLVAENCKLFCWHEDFNCTTYRIYATKAFVETVFGPKSKCYTSLDDLVTGKSIEATPPPGWYSAQFKFDRRKENLINGIYDYTHCYVSAQILKPYFVIDLGAIYSFKMITFTCQNDPWAQEYCRELYLRISNTSAPTQGDFSSFEDYGYFAGPGTPDQTVTIWKKSSARYISMQMDLGQAEYLFICFLRVI